MTFDFDAILDRRGTGSYKWDFCERAFGEKDVIPMWVADMDFAAPPAVIDALKARAAHGAYGYPMAPKSFWTTLSEWLKRRQDWAVGRNAMTLLPGVVPALNLCVNAFTRPGDKIVIQTPVYHPFYGAVENNGRRIVRNPLAFDGRRFTMDFDHLKSLDDARTRMIILCSPHNPVGRVWTGEELGRLAEIAAGGGWVVVADEIHGDLILPGRRFTPFAAISKDAADRTVTLTAPSKTFNVAGLSTAAAIIGNTSLKALFDSQVQSSGLTMGNVFGLAAFEAAYREGDAWLDALLAYLAGNAEFAGRFLAERTPGIRLIAPEGTYLGLLDCRGLGLEQVELDRFFLREAKVYFDPGPRFGEELRGFQRINLGCPRPLLREALERIERALRAREARTGS
jgi:cystathionine beta-lyase